MKDAWGEAPATERAEVLNAITDAVEKNKDVLAAAESRENGKPVRETLAADIPLVIDHFRYFAATARAEEGRSTEIEKNLVAYHFREPLGVVGQIIPCGRFCCARAAGKRSFSLASPSELCGLDQSGFPVIHVANEPQPVTFGSGRGTSAPAGKTSH